MNLVVQGVGGLTTLLLPFHITSFSRIRLCQHRIRDDLSSVLAVPQLASVSAYNGSSRGADLKIGLRSSLPITDYHVLGEPVTVDEQGGPENPPPATVLVVAIVRHDGPSALNDQVPLVVSSHGRSQ
ncbi:MULTISPECIES: hypothetical protein [unclassified Bradyrhizobium]|uniref:hypothetical protein n=1 Tax=unclassified Bradyrhizobium TaxID=2631580 RepID=UPI0024795BD5|nr:MULTISPECIES: hypothetical protein [unclassified Bradyrhizobium]WGR93287.1 hypothetical protein MTX20_37035 [Bradyrhizobium sp. ISRA435]WGR97816.1 hypothetical protein MTX23_26040 [Bradyrhizobium sp. ISRA436]WGS04705.1 hypothetical protein MTX18_26045 [Bradyrhizobium sp. ISRA437]WGS11586.1 hypothetical protein MTX26_26045 [Bradyrhizobium sp. ISRA443]WGS19075.1 hypothetical protein MTX22_31995 [Bradyrhizobium sp. ISRA463]